MIIANTYMLSVQLTFYKIPTSYKEIKTRHDRNAWYEEHSLWKNNKILW